MREVLVIKKFFQSQGISEKALIGFDNLIMSDNSHLVTCTIKVQKSIWEMKLKVSFNPIILTKMQDGFSSFVAAMTNQNAVSSIDFFCDHAFLHLYYQGMVKLEVIHHSLHSRMPCITVKQQVTLRSTCHSLNRQLNTAACLP